MVLQFMKYHVKYYYTHLVVNIQVTSSPFTCKHELAVFNKSMLHD